MAWSVRMLMVGGLVLPELGSSARIGGEPGPVVVLSRVARDSMNAAFARSNEHWNELADLNAMERMLGTIRPTQREYLGCLQGTADSRTIRIDGWIPPSDMKRLQLAVAGSCDPVPRLVGTWHTHPYPGRPPEPAHQGTPTLGPGSRDLRRLAPGGDAGHVGPGLAGRRGADARRPHRPSGPGRR